MAAINNDWLDALKGEFKKPYYRKLYDTVKRETKNTGQDRYFRLQMIFLMHFI